MKSLKEYRKLDDAKQLDEGFKKWKVTFKKGSFNKIQFQNQHLEIVARNTSEAAKKAVMKLGVKKDDWAAAGPFIKSIDLVESTIDEAAKAPQIKTNDPRKKEELKQVMHDIRIQLDDIASVNASFSKVNSDKVNVKGLQKIHTDLSKLYKRIEKLADNRNQQLF